MSRSPASERTTLLGVSGWRLSDHGPEVADDMRLIGVAELGSQSRPAHLVVDVRGGSHVERAVAPHHPFGADVLRPLHERGHPSDDRIGLRLEGQQPCSQLVSSVLLGNRRIEQPSGNRPIVNADHLLSRDNPVDETSDVPVEERPELLGVGRG